MEFKSCPLLSVVLLILVASFHNQVSAVSRSAISRFWQPIKDVNLPRVLKNARFAVSEHNKNATAKLQFVKVVTGTIGQYMLGKDYQLVITANDAAAGNAPGNYEAEVWDSCFPKVRHLESFVKV